MPTFTTLRNYKNSVMLKNPCIGYLEIISAMDGNTNVIDSMSMIIKNVKNKSQIKVKKLHCHIKLLD